MQGTAAEKLALFEKVKVRGGFAGRGASQGRADATDVCDDGEVIDRLRSASMSPCSSEHSCRVRLRIRVSSKRDPIKNLPNAQRRRAGRGKVGAIPASTCIVPKSSLQ